MAQFSVNTERFDPYKNFKFKVKWNGKYVAGISKVTGFTRKTEPIEHREGGDPSTKRKSPGPTSYDPISLERGVTHDLEFEKWANLVHNYKGDALMSLKDFRKDIRIELLNEQGTIVLAYNVYRCWVSEYTPLTDLDAGGNAVAIQKIVLQNEGWSRDEAVKEPKES